MFRLILLLICIFPSFAAYTVHEGKLINDKTAPKLSVQEHYSLMLTAYQEKHWQDLVRQGRIVMKNFSKASFVKEANYFLGIGYLHLGEYEYANRYLSRYLQSEAAPKFFEEALRGKLALAEQFRGGAKKHLLGVGFMPKWAPADEEALEMYEEVITSLPNHELAAEALFGKASLFFAQDDFKTSIESFQTLVRRFPRHALAPESYLKIGEVYLRQCQVEFPDPDFLDLALINLRKFRTDFPGEQRLAGAEENVCSMQEVYARSLYETGNFYERTKKNPAALIYYRRVIELYPETKTAARSQKRIAKLTG